MAHLTGALLRVSMTLAINTNQNRDIRYDLKDSVSLNIYHIYFNATPHFLPFLPSLPLLMAVPMSATRIFARSSRQFTHSSFFRPVTLSATQTSSLHTSTSRRALPHGPPPDGYRMPKPTRWNTDSEYALDKAGRYFLLTEMLRGMWVVLEQFFRPPFVIALLTSQGYGTDVESQIHDLLPFRKRPHFPSFPRRARTTPVSHGGRTLHCVQAVRGNLSRFGNHY